MTPGLSALLSRSAGRDPDAVAIVHGDERLSYAELERRTNQLGRMLRRAGCQPQDRVAIALPKSIDAVTAILGTLKAGCVYVPLEPSTPAARLGSVLANCDPRIVLVRGSGPGSIDAALEQLPTGDRPGRACLDEPGSDRRGLAFDGRDVRAADDAALDVPTGPDDLAYIFFTSGSTGVPKGVMVTHASVLRFVTWANAYFEAGPGERFSAVFPLQFDLSVHDLFGALEAGAELHLIGPELTLLPHKLAAYIRERRLTQWFCVPSLLAYMARADVIETDDFPALKRVLCCGEVLPAPTLIHWMQRLPHVRFTNLYGPTEATIASSYYTIPTTPADPAAPIPIGRPCDGEELLILSAAGQPVGPGELGELHIGGVGLARGYWCDPERTAAAFIRDPRDPGRRLYRTGDLARQGPDGLYYFAGRADTQIKSRGYRIELGDIESALHAIDGIDECAVVALPSDGFDGAVICCAYVVAGAAPASPQLIRGALAQRLPAYMIPTRWKAYTELPRNASGKIDRGAIQREMRAQEAARR